MSTKNIPTSLQTFDGLFKQLNRSAIGYDNWPNIWTEIQSKTPSFPPYDIVKHNEDDYEIVVALAGYSAKDVDIGVENQMLIIKHEKQEEQDYEGPEYLHRGIAKRSFNLKFTIHEHCEVDSALMKDGMLTIKLTRTPPPEMTTKIPIKQG